MCLNTNNTFFAFTDKSYCVTINIFLNMYYKILSFLKSMTILIHTNCVNYHVVYWTGYCDCVHHGLKCAPKSLRTYVYFTRLQEGKYFCCNKLFTPRKLTGDENSFSVSSLFQLNDTTNLCTANRGHSDHYRRLDFTFQHTHTHKHTRIYVFGNFYWKSWGIFRLR